MVVVSTTSLRRHDPSEVLAEGDPSPLLPELAQLQRLTLLELVRYGAAPWPALPQECLVPDAFPALER